MKYKVRLETSLQCSWRREHIFHHRRRRIVGVSVCANSTYERRRMGDRFVSFSFSINKRRACFSSTFAFSSEITRSACRQRACTYKATVVSNVNEQLKNDMHAVNSRQEAPTCVDLLKRVRKAANLVWFRICVVWYAVYLF